MYGGAAAAQYPVYGSGPAGGMMTAAAAAFYPYLQYGGAEGTATAATTGGYTSGQGYGAVNYPPHMFQYSPIASTGGYAQHYGTPISLAPSPALQSGFYLHLVCYTSLIFIYETCTNTFDSVFCCAAGVSMALQAPIPHR